MKALTDHERDVLAAMFTRARVEPSDEDWAWAHAMWAQGVRAAPVLDRVLQSRLQIKAEQTATT